MLFMKKKFTLEEIIDFTETWLIQGDLNTEFLADNFQFISPFWSSNTRQAFIDKFKHSTVYQETALKNIVKFDPVIKFKSLDGTAFSIILQYHTKNGSSVYEAVLGKIYNGLLYELRSIYDLEATKKAHDL